MLYLSRGIDKARQGLLGQPCKEETNPAARRPCRHTPTVLSPSLCLIRNFSPEQHKTEQIFSSKHATLVSYFNRGSASQLGDVPKQGEHLRLAKYRPAPPQRCCGCLGYKCATREENTPSVTGGGQKREGTPEKKTILLKMVLILIDQSKSLT